jgi:hypothetical protein
MTGGRTPGRVLLASMLAAALAGCGAQNPKPPPPDASRLDHATSGISTACGEAYRATAFPDHPRALLARLDRSATVYARTLARVYHRNAEWVFRGETVRQIVADSVSLLGSCGLRGAHDELVRATRQ